MKRKESESREETESGAPRTSDSKQQTSTSDVSSNPVAAHHRVMGNRAVQRLHETGELQAKRSVSNPHDRSEREAERVADRIVDTGNPELAAGTTTDIRRRKTAGSAATVDEESQRRIRSLKGGGRPLPGSERSFFEPRFGRDLGDVRVHTGPQADEAARAINAEAFTTGSDIFFRGGAYRPGTDEGRSLLAHELTHVVQQGATGGGDAARTVQRQASESGGDSGESGASKTNWGPDWLPDVVAAGQSPAGEGDVKAPIEYDWGDQYETWGGETVFEGGTLYVKGPNDQRHVAPDDVQQMMLGNCYFLATMKAIAQQKPSVVRQMIERKANGYDVTFYRTREGRYAAPGHPDSSPFETIFVSDQFLSAREGLSSPAPAEEAEVSANKPEVWVKVLEKAWAKRLGATRAEKSGMTAPDRLKELMKLSGEGAQQERMRKLHRAILGQEAATLTVQFTSSPTKGKLAAAVASEALQEGNPVTVHVHVQGNWERYNHRLVGVAGASHAYWIKEATEERLLFVDPLAQEALDKINAERESSDWGVFDQATKRKKETWIQASELGNLDSNLVFYINEGI